MIKNGENTLYKRCFIQSPLSTHPHEFATDSKIWNNGSVAIFGISSKRCADWFTMYSAYYAKQSVVNNQLFFGGFEGAVPYRNTYNMF